MDLRISTIATIMMAILYNSAAVVEEVCDRDTFRGNCPAGSVLEMTAARYGRVKVGGCISSDLGFLGCGKDALPEMDAWCSGRQSCSVKVDDEENEDLNQGNTCDKDIASHLEVNYQCVRVYEKHHCGGTKTVVPLNEQVLSSSVSDSSGCGSMTSPYSIKMTAGQKLSITLTDFGWGRISAWNEECKAYAYIVEKSVGVNQTVCGGSEKEKYVYTSTSDHVIIQIVPSRARDSEFLFRFAVAGCPDITPPAHAWYKRDGDSAVIGCEWSEHSWHLTCEGSTWMGVVGNCSESGHHISPTETMSYSLSPVLSIGIITGLAVLILALLCIVCIGCICLRRRNNTASEARKTDTLTGQQQACLYYSGRPVPLADPQATLVGHHPKGAPASQSLHIWEQPLPQEPVPGGQADAGTYQNQGTLVTMPRQGTMTGPAVQCQVGNDTQSQSGTWDGTKHFYDSEKGWMQVP